MIIAFTIQLYFLMANFWITARLSDGNSSNTYPSYNQVFNYIRLSGTSNMAYSKLINEVTLSQAIACAISMFVGIFPVLGRVGPMEVLLICLIGTFAYALNEGVFWNLFIEDNGYGMRIFLFGSSMGIITSLILGKREKTAQHPEYTTDYDHQFTGLVGSVFICVLLPWLSVIDQLPGMAEATYFQIAPLNIWLAISGSVCTSFCTSIWLHGKISNHEIVMSCFSVLVKTCRVPSLTEAAPMSSRIPSQPS